MAPCTGGRIVIVDDMQMMLVMIKDVLEEAGIKDIVTFDDPGMAIRTMRRNGEPSLIITDYNMPGMNGLELLNEISKTFPDVPGILISSEVEKIPCDTRQYPVISKWLLTSKPFRELVKKLAKCS